MMKEQEETEEEVREGEAAEGRRRLVQVQVQGLFVTYTIIQRVLIGSEM